MTVMLLFIAFALIVVAVGLPREDEAHRDARRRNERRR